MNRLLLMILIPFAFIACKPKAPEGSDVLRKIQEEKYLENRKEELSLEVMASDTARSRYSPVQVSEARVNKDYSGGYKPEVFLEFVNQSSKAVDGIRIRVHCFNNFDEPAGGAFNNTFNATIQETVEAGKKGAGIWEILSIPGATKAYAAVTEVHFIDGTSWKADSVKNQ